MDQYSIPGIRPPSSPGLKMIQTFLKIPTCVHFVKVSVAVSNRKPNLLVSSQTRKFKYNFTS